MVEKSVSIIIPAYNEEKGIAKTIDALQQCLTALPLQSEIIVVDDGSADNTASIAKEKGVQLIQHPTNMGYGASIKAGVKASQYDNILIIDADGTYPVNAIPQLIDHLPTFDMVVGARITKNASIPLIRRPAKWFLSQMANFLSDTKILDLNSGLRVIKKDLFLKYVKILPSGFSLTTTITLALHSNGYAVHYLPISYHPRVGKSKIRPIHDTFNFAVLILRTMLLFNPLKIFLTVGITLMGLGIGLLFFSWFFLPKLLDNTATILFIGGLQILAVGMISDLINRRID